MTITLTDFLKKWLPRQSARDRETLMTDAANLLKPPDSEIWVESIISSRDMRPVVGVRIGPYAFQLSPDEARKIGRDFYEVAGGSENDAFLFQKLTVDLKLGPEYAYALINELRQWRGSRMNQASESLKTQ